MSPKKKGAPKRSKAVQRSIDQQDVQEASESSAPQELTLEQAMQWAMQLHQAGRIREAHEVYEKILAAEANHIDALHYLGVVKHQLGQSSQAVELIRKAVELNPSYMAARNNLGNVLLEIGELQGAAEQFEACLHQQPDSADALNNLGSIRRRLGETERAMQLFQRAIECDSSHVEALRNLGNVYRLLGRPEESAESFRQAMALKPNDTSLFLNLNQSLRHAGRKEEAERVLQDWLFFEPDNATAQHLLKASQGGAVAERAADEYVREHFDGSAHQFEDRLRELQYEGHGKLEKLLAEHAEPSGQLRVLDVGCGTGLCAPLLRPYASHLAGVDLSGEMIEIVRGKNLYDQLETAELTDFLRRFPDNFDLIVAADTLVYFGELDSVFEPGFASLRDGGTFAFFVEDAGDPEVAPETGDEGAGAGFEIIFQGRIHRHNRRYLEACLARHGLNVITIRRDPIRMECGEQVWGWYVMAGKPG